MQVQQLPIYQFLEGSGKSFVIPVYQRDYAWKRVQCQKLWDDIVGLDNSNRPDHFLGTIVTIGSGFQEYTVIDGQQRLTTISLLLVALHKYLLNKETKTIEEISLAEQVQDFLINKYSKDQSKRIRLKPNKQDKLHFENLFGSYSQLTTDSNITNNFKFFLDKISEGTVEPMRIFDNFRKLKIVLIDLIRGQDDPQLIFESLNSTGVDLTAGDLIRNYILMDLEPEIQELYYRKYWAEIESLTEDVAEFIRNYLIYKTKTSIKKDDVYNTFKVYSLKNFYKEKELILTDLLKHAEVFSWFEQKSHHRNLAIDVELSRLKNLEFTVCYPYLLDVFEDVANNILSEDTALQVIKLIESYAFRKIIVDNTTQGLNKLFVSLSKDVKREDEWKKDYLNILSFIVLSKQASQRIPNDEEFENALMYKEVYRLQNKNKTYLLESLENYNSAYKVDLEDLSIEHIMPQTLTEDWKQKLGENWQEIHKKYLHTIGNLSLTARNSELSNNSFTEKQKIDYQLSKLKLNSGLDNIKVWKEERIVQRAKELISEILIIWKFPVTTFSKQAPEEQIYDLTSEDSFSNSKPTRLFIGSDDKGMEVKTWRDIYITVSAFLADYSPTEFNTIKTSSDFSWYFNINRPMRSELEFKSGQYIEGGISANGIVAFLKRLCEKLDYEPEKIQFAVKNV